MRTFYFGCWKTPGHYLWAPGMRSVYRREFDPETQLPWGYKIDSGLAPCVEYPDGRAVAEAESGRSIYGKTQLPNGQGRLHHKDGWTALSFWENTWDSRGNVNGTFLFDVELDFDQALAAAKKHFPELFAAFMFEISEAPR